MFAKEEEYKYYIYNEDDNNIKTFEKVPAEYFTEDGDLGGRQQTCMVNGIIYQLMIGNAPRENYLAIIDAQTEELIMWKIFRNRIEIEGIYFHEGSFYVMYQNSLIYKLGTHGDDFVATEDYLRNNNNAMTVYVDNHYTGVQKGANHAPFSSLTMALAMTNELPSTSVYLAKSSTKYNIDEGLMRFSVDGSFICYHERLCFISYTSSIDNNDTEATESIVTGPFQFRGLVFRADGIHFEGVDKGITLVNVNEPPRSLMRIVFNECTISNYLYAVFGNYNYEVKAVNCTFTNLTRIVNGGYGDIYIEGCTLTTMSHVTSGYGDIYIKGSTLTGITYLNPLATKSITLYNNRYSNVSIATVHCIPDVICDSNDSVDNFIYDHLNNGLVIGSDGINLHINRTNGTPSSIYGVTYVRGTYHSFVMGEVAENDKFRFRGKYCRIFPLREVAGFNNASATFRELFEGTFDKSNNNVNYGVRMYKETPESAPVAVPSTQDGKTAYTRYGTIRPTMHFLEDIGNSFFDTTINKLIYWTGDTMLGADGWVDGMGNNPDSPDKGKVAIIGDSISSYAETSPSGYLYHYPTAGDLTTVNQIWWKMLSNNKRLTPVNCSWSATNVTGAPKATTAQAGCSDKRVEDAGREGNPDYVLILMGTNDMRQNVSLGTWQAGDPIPDDSAYGTSDTISTFKEAYVLMLNKLKTAYPDAKIYCCSLLEETSSDYAPGSPWNNENGDTVADFNNAIEYVAEAMGCRFLDMHNCGITYENASEYLHDGLHPNKAGQKLMGYYAINNTNI